MTNSEPMPPAAASRVGPRPSVPRKMHRPEPPTRERALRELDPAAVIARYRIEGRRNVDEFRTRECPKCGQRDRDAVSVNLVTGFWCCFAHGCRGDVLALLAGYAGLGDDAASFADVLALAGDVIAGSGPRDVRRLRTVIEPKWTAERLDGAATRAGRVWASFVTRSPLGEAYVTARGLGDILATGLVRFAGGSAPAVALFDEAGRVVNVVRRMREPTPDAPKHLGLRDCPTMGSFVGHVAQVTASSHVVLTEGVFDALTARLAWPGAVVLGAHGAGNLARLADAAAARGPASLRAIPHADEAGRRHMEAARQAVAARGGRLELVGLDTKDLNAAWCVGWRPRSEVVAGSKGGLDLPSA
jgi:hypothetical protein